MTSEQQHRRVAKMKRDVLRADGAAVPRFNQRVDAAGKPAPPPPPWFTLVAALVPAIPYASVLPLSTLLLWLPVWICAFYYLPRPVAQLSPCLVLCIAVTAGALWQQGWSSRWLLLLSPTLGFLMNLVESALWDTLEPFLVGKPGFGAGQQVEVHRECGASGERVTAASSVLAGDPSRAAAASAFTQLELDTLAAHGLKPWDPEAQAALTVLEGGGTKIK